MEKFQLLQGDCLESLRLMPDNSVDSVVTDPPYGLSDHKPGDVVACLTAWLSGEEYRPNKKGFMGRAWDSWVPGPEVWREVFRVLKPGGHVVAFAGSRTHDLMSMALRLAGFENRDTVMWVYGSGFPKSMDVSKAIDKARSEDIEPVRAICRVLRAAMEAKGLKSRNLVEHFGGCNPRLIDHWAARDTDSQPSLPTWDQWLKLREVLNLSGVHDAEVWRLNGRKGQPGDVWQNAEIIGEHQGQTPGFVGQRFSTTDNKIRELSDSAGQWAGWGTALKPAFEPALLFRKPLVGTVAENVLAHGTGALNIDGCRVSADGDPQLAAKYASVQKAGNRENSINGSDTRDRAGAVPHDAGRFPSNLIHDGSPEVLALFPDSDGAGPSLPRVKITGYGDGVVGSGASDYLGGERIPYNAGSGSAARFFYCAKASRKDRNEGLPIGGEPAVGHGATLREQEDADWSKRNGNHHPTVKPTDLMRYLCRLVTPPGGVVLDPFTGSGSTGKAAMLEGFRFIGCELSEEYLEIARARIEHSAKVYEATRPKPEQPIQPDLFGEAAA